MAGIQEVDDETPDNVALCASTTNNNLDSYGVDLSSPPSSFVAGMPCKCPQGQKQKTVSHSAPWIFNTGASAHMTPNLDQFSTIEMGDYGFVSAANGGKMKMAGRGTVSLLSVLPDGTEY